MIFDDLADHFARKIYGSKKGNLRLTLLWEDMLQQLPVLTGGQPLDILEAGGGFGQMSIKLAELQHRVVLTEPSAKMLEKARECITQSAASNTLTLHQSTLQDLPKLYPNGSFDMIVCHAVLEWLADPLPTLATVLPLLKQGGYLSLAFYNVESIIWKNLLKGNFLKVLTRQFAGEAGGLTPPHPQSARDILPWLEAQQFQIMNTRGIRCLSDYLHSATKVSEDDLLAMERQLGQEEPYKWLGRYIHVIARRQC